MDINQIYELINKISSTYGVDSILIRAVVNAESSFNPSAIRPEANGMTSYGLMQVTLPTAQQVAGPITTDQLMIPDINLSIGTSYLSSLLDRYGNIPDAVAAYNAGVPRKNTSGQYINSKGLTNVDTYVNRVMSYYYQYGGEEQVSYEDQATQLPFASYLPKMSNENYIIIAAIIAILLIGVIL